MLKGSLSKIVEPGGEDKLSRMAGLYYCILNKILSILDQEEYKIKFNFQNGFTLEEICIHQATIWLFPLNLTLYITHYTLLSFCFCFQRIFKILEATFFIKLKAVSHFYII